jgi:hypothetical protein
MYMYSIPNGFRDRAVSLYSSNIFYNKLIQYYVLFLILIFILQVTNLK